MLRVTKMGRGYGHLFDFFRGLNILYRVQKFPPCIVITLPQKRVDKDIAYGNLVYDNDAGVAKLVDARDLKSLGSRSSVPVRVRPSADRFEDKALALTY